MFKSLTFWTLLVGVLAFVIRWFAPTFPLDNASILALVLFALGLFGIVPSIRGAVTFGSLLTSLAFWQLIVGIAAFVIHYFLPNFPFGETEILAAVLFILGLFSINPELRRRGLLK